MIHPSNSDGKYTRLSQSPIWELQRQYYKTLGNEAWRPNRVPNFITTNSFIAHSYAQVMLAFVEDWHQKNELNNSDPIYIFELGAGSGRFAHYFLNHFFKSLAEKKIAQDVVYVMTDISEANIEFWQNNCRFKSFINSGQLDFAFIDVWEGADVDLRVSGQRLSVRSLSAPVGIIANYVFDSVPTDLFSIKNGTLNERSVAISSDGSGNDIEEHIKGITISYRETPCTADYYDRADLNAVLEQYLDDGEDFRFAVPVGALRGMEKLGNLTRETTFLLTGDYGDTSLLATKDVGRQHQVVKNGTFTVRTNYDAAAIYCRHNNGDYFHSPKNHNAISIAGFLTGKTYPEYSNLEFAFKKYVNEFGPEDFYSLKERLCKNLHEASFDQLLAFIRLSKWDTKVFLLCFPSLYAVCSNISVSQKQILRIELDNVENLNFFCDPETDILQEIAQLRAVLGEYEKS